MKATPEPTGKFVLYPWKGNGVYPRKALSWMQTTHRTARVLYCSMCGEEILRDSDYWRGIDHKKDSRKISCSAKCVKVWSPECSV